jgi:hypothetical protein
VLLPAHPKWRIYLILHNASESCTDLEGSAKSVYRFLTVASLAEAVPKLTRVASARIRKASIVVSSLQSLCWKPLPGASLKILLKILRILWILDHDLGLEGKLVAHVLQTAPVRSHRPVWLPWGCIELLAQARSRHGLRPRSDGHEPRASARRIQALVRRKVC